MLVLVDLESQLWQQTAFEVREDYISEVESSVAPQAHPVQLGVDSGYGQAVCFEWLVELSALLVLVVADTEQEIVRVVMVEEGMVQGLWWSLSD